ncbi:MAG: FAD-dependent oxidoreductase [Candidatus Geothermincolales bacterium]
MRLRRERAELVVVGAGPAGLCAAATAARQGVPVVVLDENTYTGGQLRKQIHRFFGSGHHFAGLRGFEIADILADEAKGCGADIRLGSFVQGFFPSGELMVEGEGEVYLVEPEAVVLCTGAMERALPFPGWTLPGVMGAGAAQTLMNLHRVLPGRKVVMVGSGNVGLIVAYQLLQAGAEVQAVLEISSRVGGYRVHETKLRREGVPIFLRHRLVAALGNGEVEAVVAEDMERGVYRRWEADCLCLALGMSPLVELAAMRGCRMVYVPELGGTLPWHSQEMTTSVPGIFVAGDAAGVEEASVAMDEGRLAGLGAARFLGRLGDEEYRKAAEEIKERLTVLRAGSGTEAKRRARESLWRDELRGPGR